MHLVRTGGREAHQLAGTQGCSVRFVRASKSQGCSVAPPGQHNNHRPHKEDVRNPLHLFVQGRPSVVAPSHQEESHSSSPSVDFHTGEHRGRFPQQTQAAEVGFQTSPIRVLEDLPETASLAHTGCLCVQRESSGSHVHDLGARPKGNGNQYPGLLLGSSNLVIPHGSSHSSSTGGHSRAAD